MSQAETEGGVYSMSAMVRFAKAARRLDPNIRNIPRARGMCHVHAKPPGLCPSPVSNDLQRIRPLPRSDRD